MLMMIVMVMMLTINADDDSYGHDDSYGSYDVDE